MTTFRLDARIYVIVRNGPLQALLAYANLRTSSRWRFTCENNFIFFVYLANLAAALKMYRLVWLV